jgi:NADPH-dependent 2,4-dienoyl-CoA reductase/sulfur reductase-like enzyme
MAIKRRSFIKSAIAVTASAAMPLSACVHTSKSSPQRVVIIGGGFAGATAAKYLRLWGPHIEVILIERNAQFISCPQSNLVLSGARTLPDLTLSYDGLEQRGVQLVHAEVSAIDVEKRSVGLSDKTEITYDRLVIAPGVDFIYDELPALASDYAQQRVPHAWKAGPQTERLKQQIVSMRQGGQIVMTIPQGPFRCPPGPYERACQIANYLKNNNPTAKLLVVDANADVISKKNLFKSAWQKYYADVIEYMPNNRLEAVSLESLEIETEFEHYQADVLNVIPPQKAGKVAAMAGVINVDNRWCEVDFLTYESKVQANVHVIGDAIAAKLPKSGHMANAHAKVCAAAIIDLFANREPEQEPVINNTCYSFVDQQQAMHVAAVYRYDKQTGLMKAMPGGGLSDYESLKEGKYAAAWAENIWQDSLR